MSLQPPAASELTNRAARVLVAICTRDRPHLLQSCLDSVCAQIPHEGAEMDLLVVENNDRLTCQDIVERQRQTSGRTIHLVLEPELGIPFARNRCGIWGQESGYDWILLIDDDEIARKDWFRAMVDASRAFTADVFHGPVISVYPTDAPSWIMGARKRSRPTGAVMTKAATNNTMVSARVFAPDGYALSFDPNLRFSGGEDTDFFLRLSKAGGKILWINEAVVEEPVNDGRLSLKWQLQRTFRVAINIAMQHGKMHGLLSSSFRIALKAIGRIFQGLAKASIAAILFVFAPQTSKRTGFAAAKDFASGLGSIAYLFGFRPQPYKQVDGR